MKKRFLELLVKTAGLIPKDVKSYRTDGCGGQYEVGVGWMGEGLDEEGDVVLYFCQPDGFNDAVSEILRYVKDNPEIKIRTELEFKV